MERSGVNINDADWKKLLQTPENTLQKMQNSVYKLETNGVLELDKICTNVEIMEQLTAVNSSVNEITQQIAIMRDQLPQPIPKVIHRVTSTFLHEKIEEIDEHLLRFEEFEKDQLNGRYELSVLEYLPKVQQRLQEIELQLHEADNERIKDQSVILEDRGYREHQEKKDQYMFELVACQNLYSSVIIRS